MVERSDKMHWRRKWQTTSVFLPWDPYDQPKQYIKKERHYFASKGPLVKAMVSPVVTYGCESWTIKKAEHWRIDASELWCWRETLFFFFGDTLESPLDCKEIQPVHPKGNQSWIVIGRTDAEAETPILWPLDSKSRLTGKDLDAGKDWRWEEKVVTEDEMVGLHHQLDGHEFEYALGVGDGWSSLVCWSLWVAKSQTWLSDWTKLKIR